jgi:hypothetical protein
MDQLGFTSNGPYWVVIGVMNLSENEYTFVLGHDRTNTTVKAVKKGHRGSKKWVGIDSARLID